MRSVGKIVFHSIQGMHKLLIIIIFFGYKNWKSFTSRKNIYNLVTEIEVFKSIAAEEHDFGLFKNMFKFVLI